MTSWTRLVGIARNPGVFRCSTLLPTSGSKNVPIVLRRPNWVNPKYRFKKKSKSAMKSRDVIIEGAGEVSEISNRISDFKYYLKTTEIPQKLRLSLLKTKLAEIVHDVDDYSSNQEMISTINAVFMHLYRTHGGSLEGILSPDEIYKLFQKTAGGLPQSGLFELPEFMVRLTQQFLTSDQIVPDKTLLLIITLGSSLKFSEFSAILGYIIKNKKSLLSSTFSKAVLDHLKDRNELNLASYEAFLSVSNGEISPLLLTDEFATSFMSFVETLFEERNPRVHEYQELDKNVYRIQFVTNRLIEQAFDHLQTNTCLTLLKFKADLNTVVASDLDVLKIQKMFTILNEKGKDSDFMDIKAVIFKHDLFDESLADTLLVELTKQRELFAQMRLSLSEFIMADDVKFTLSLRLKAAIMQVIESSEDSEEDLLPVLKSVFTPYLELTENLQDSYTNIVQVLMFSGKAEPNGTIIQRLKEVFQVNYEFEPTILSFQYRIDRGIEMEDAVQSYQVFEESLKYGSVHWNLNSDPSILQTLSKLIQALGETEEGISTIFPKFRKIKLHMSTQVSAEAINALAKKMLVEECVGDTKELLKRELPTIPKDSVTRIQVTPPWAYAYGELFNTLHNFVISYANEETHETNWVLYGELHKYFEVPYNTYMPALEFFCKVDRLNAALVIFRQIKKLNELHGTTQYLPPLRDMYMFLLRTFGDRLYEEGVVEIHEYLNMDVHIQDQDIDLQNCILNAYSNLQSVGRARDLFLTISANAKQNGGINEETIQIMIKTYTYSDMLYVKKFWNNLSQFGIFPDYNIYKQYLIAHVYHGLTEDAFALVDEIDDYNIDFSPDLLLSMYNYCLDLEKQVEIEKWAIENHREEWESVKQSGLLKTASNYMPDTNLLIDGGHD